ncbi:MAG: 5'/3'-nucleotidase SurE [Gammaproteobacteria bacterium]|nr:5'/3'-nucleotidase SurE [Gammaproteobacteria bacterium]
MQILISNDDGVEAPGILSLKEGLADMASLILVAPDRDRSGASNSLTLDSPIRAKKISDDMISVAGTPTDCVHLALTGLLEYEPDMVISGINAGANMGDDVLYSGTVAAAMEGRFLGLPSIAISLASKGDNKPLTHYDTAVQVARFLIKRLKHAPFPSNTILNVNVPDCPWDKVKGIQSTRLGHRHKAEPVIKEKDPRGRNIYWVGPPGAEQDAGEGTDFHALKNNYVSVTPLQVDLTRHEDRDGVADWLEQDITES